MDGVNEKHIPNGPGYKYGMYIYIKSAKENYI